MFIQNISNLRCALYGVLNYLGFQPDKVKWTNILYTGFEANVLINCHFSKPISISRGVHQGGPSSGLFFLTCDEFLALNIKRIFHIKEIPVEDILKLTGQYTDDFNKVFCSQACLTQTTCNFRVFRV